MASLEAARIGHRPDHSVGVLAVVIWHVITVEERADGRGLLGHGIVVESGAVLISTEVPECCH